MKLIESSAPGFEEIITKGKLYVDKTDYIYNILNGPKMNFCARPRRFGKSMTISTLEAIFKGKRDLFKGLAIDSKPYDWKVYPVIHIDFGSCGATTTDEFNEELGVFLRRIAQDYGITLSLSMTRAHLLFDELIYVLSKKLGPVVILIDEYDKLISDNFYSDNIEQLRTTLGKFYEVIKTQYNHIRFAFITGVTKYSKLSVFSKMNNLRDYTMEKKYACMFGYTQAELEHYFVDYIEEGLKNTSMDRETYLAKIKAQYDGYCFYPGAETVYNPVSIGCFFDDGGVKLRNYWIDTGNTSLLMEIARRINFNLIKDMRQSISTDALENFDIVALRERPSVSMLKSLLLQTGYLTIKDEINDSLFLDFPNQEVRISFSSNILSAYYPTVDDFRDKYNNLKSAFSLGNVESAIRIFRSIYSAIPGTIHEPTEAYYHSIFEVILLMFEADMNNEEANSGGRADTVLKVGNHIYVIEFKKGLSAEKAVAQIRDNHYADKYILDPMGKTIHLLGIAFGEKERNIVDWKDVIVE